MALTEQALKNYLAKVLKVDPGSIADDTALFSDGLLDSFAMVDLILFVESEGGFQMDPADISLDNLDSISRILDLANRLAT